MRKPDFFIVGAPKCGTTAMYQYLKQHPDIFMPNAKELHFFGSDLEFPSVRINEQEYFSYFQNANQQKRMGEASVLYLYSKRAANEIKQFEPSASIIVMLRNPVDMIYSSHSQLVYNGNEEIQDFEAALKAEESRKKGFNKPKYFMSSLFYRDTANYTEQLARYFKSFGRENVQVIIYDDFRQEPASVYKDTLQFLKVNETFQPHFEIINANKKVRHRFLRNFLKEPPLPIKKLARLVLTSSLRHTIYTKARQYNTLYVKRSPMNLELRKKLQAGFLPEIEKLSQLLDRDLTHWCQ